MKKIQLISLLFLTLCLTGIEMIQVEAVNKIPTETVEKIGGDKKENSKPNYSNSNPNYTYENGYLELDENGQVVGNPSDKYMEKVTINEVNEKITRKTIEGVEVVRAFGLPATIIMFIASAIYTVFGCITKKGVLLKGAMAMSICIICFACIQYAYPIVNFFVGWLAN